MKKDPRQGYEDGVIEMRIQCWDEKQGRKEFQQQGDAVCSFCHEWKVSLGLASERARAVEIRL